MKDKGKDKNMNGETDRQMIDPVKRQFHLLTFHQSASSNHRCTRVKNPGGGSVLALILGGGSSYSLGFEMGKGPYFLILLNFYLKVF